MMQQAQAKQCPTLMPIVRAFYDTYLEGTTQELYDYVGKELNIGVRTKDLEHNIRGDQSTLQREGYIVNIYRGYWKKV